MLGPCSEEAVQAFPTGILILDVKGTVQICNAAAATLLNLPFVPANAPVVLAWQQITTLCDAQKQPLSGEAVGKLLETVGSLRFWSYIEGEVGMWLETVTAPLPMGGVVVSIQDVSGRVGYEWLLEQRNAQLARVNKDLEQFVYVASHDLLQPLTALEQWTELLLKDLARLFPQGLPAPITEATQIIGDGAQQMHQMVVGVRDLSRVETKQQPWTVVDLGILVESASKYLQIPVYSTGLQPVFADTAQIGLVFKNLLENSQKFGATHVQIQAEPRMGRLHITVQDDGIGMEEKYAETAFRLFGRLAPAEYEGTGVGLALCRKIVHRHGGEIGVRSQLGAGASFYFDLALPT